ncbi:hypothetical protein C7271_19720 [filamentous cyanobacterium CCP5]|nr:hypothetical protein C7271_19720 [filamentous cyanobacterium CCP5]
MGAISGVDSFTAAGNIGVAVMEGSVTLAVKDFETGAESSTLHAFLTINGKLEKRPIDLGPLPQTSGSFSLELPVGTDISLHNTLLIRDLATETTVAKARIA